METQPYDQESEGIIDPALLFQWEIAPSKKGPRGREKNQEKNQEENLRKEKQKIRSLRWKIEKYPGEYKYKKATAPNRAGSNWRRRHQSTTTQNRESHSRSGLARNFGNLQPGTELVNGTSPTLRREYLRKADGTNTSVIFEGKIRATPRSKHFWSSEDPYSPALLEGIARYTPNTNTPRKNRRETCGGSTNPGICTIQNREIRRQVKKNRQEGRAALLKYILGTLGNRRKAAIHPVPV